MLISQLGNPFIPRLLHKHQNLSYFKQILNTIVYPIIRRIDAFVFPPLCIVCDAPRPDHNRWLCCSCLDKITSTLFNRTACPKCGQNRSIRTCTCDIVWDYPFTSITSFLDYTDMVQTLMHHIKYQGKRDLAWYIGTLCTPFINEKITCGIDIIIPVPLHWRRLKKRGYNQAEWFARGLFHHTPSDLPPMNLLTRIRSTRSQTSLDKSSRFVNVEGAFSLVPHAPDMLRGRHVLLVDDIITTGATVSAAARTLLGGGCADVTVLSLARD